MPGVWSLICIILNLVSMPRRTSPFDDGITQAEKFLAILLDRACHATGELVRRVGHRFGNVVYQLRRRGYRIHCEPHPTKKHQYQYRLGDDEK